MFSTCELEIYGPSDKKSSFWHFVVSLSLLYLLPTSVKLLSNYLALFAVFIFISILCVHIFGLVEVGLEKSALSHPVSFRPVTHRGAIGGQAGRSIKQFNSRECKTHSSLGVNRKPKLLDSCSNALSQNNMLVPHAINP